MNPLSSELPFHVHNWLTISLKDFCIVIRKFALSVDKQAHWLQIMFPAVLNTRSLGTQVAGIANRQRACLPKLGKLCSLAFHYSSGHLSLIYLCCLFKYSTAGLCFKPLEYILITIFKENNVCCLCDTIRYIVLEFKFTLNTWRGLDVFQ